MSRDDYDPGPLTWVKGEVDHALASVLEQAVALREHPQDVSPVRFMLTHLHQVNGALDMVGLEGAKHFCQELEAMTDMFGKQRLQASEETISAFCNGVRTLSAYLDDLVNGAPDVPLRLFPALSSLAGAQGRDLPDESILFFPDTSIRAPSDLPSVEMDDAALVSCLQLQRRNFQRALLNWLRDNSAEHVAEMRQVVDAVAETQRLPMNKTLWWVAGAVLDVIAHGGGKAGLQAIQIFRRLDQQLRSMVDGTAKPTGALMRDLLFQVAKGAPVSERIEQVSQRFELEALMPMTTLGGGYAHQPGRESSALAALRAAMPQIKDAWTSVVAEGVSGLPGMIDALHAIDSSREMLSNAALRDLLMTMLAMIERTSDEPKALTETFGLDVAAALTLCENALENYAYLGKDFAVQAAQHAARLRQEDAAAGASLSSTIDVATLAAVGHEIQELLKQIETTLDLYFRNPAQKELLAPVAATLHQVAGAFSMLELTVAAALTNACDGLIAWFSAAHSQPEQQMFEKVAESLSALGYLVDDAIHEGAAAEKSIVAYLADLEEILKHIDTVAVPSPGPARAPARKRRSRKITDKAADAELLDIFLTEAEEVLGTLSECLQDLLADGNDMSALADLRRGFHTLKGSGRTVGLVALGEVAWQVEQMLNACIDSKRSPSAAELSFAGDARTAFAEWVAQLRSKGSVAVDLELWKDKAAALHEPSPLPESVAEPVPVVDDTVVLGGTHRVSRPLFEIFLREARQNLEILEKAVQLAPGQPGADCLRAAHTLSGTAATTGIPLVAELAGALESWIEAQAGGWSASVWTTFGQAVVALRLMLARVTARRNPKPQLSALESLRIAIPEKSSVPQPSPSRQATMAAASSEQRLLDIFLEEARELFPLVGEELREWRSRPAEAESPRALQRALHTLKGGARMAGEAALGDAIHDLETRVIQVLKSTPTEADFDQMFSELDDVSRRMEALDTALAPVSAAGVGEAPMPVRPEANVPVVHSLRVQAHVLDELVNEAGEISIARSRIERELGMFKHALHDLTESVTRLRGYLRELEIEADSRLQAHESRLQQVGEAFDPLEFDRYTRLQELTRMMAESVNDVSTTQHGLLDNLDETEAALHEQMRMNRDLQQELMHMRMVPFSAIGERLYRVVRQTARELGSRVELTVEGAQIEIDRSVLEKVVAPLEHLLRNAIAHGIEHVQQRLSANKSESGRITLAVRQEKNETVITVSDDGAGIDLDLVRRRATEKGMLEQGQQLSEQALMSIIFEAGFSTSSEVTQVSGRGVGLDVVHSEISKLGGRIDVASQRGQGATFSIYLPTTLTMTQVVLVRAGAYVFALPAVMVEQVQVLKAADVNAAYAATGIAWAGRHYPIHYLSRLLGDDKAMPEGQRSSPVILLRSGNYVIALHVDEILGNREVVVKQIGPQLTLVPGIVGATVLGDGKVMLIINPVQLANRAELAAGTVHVSAIPEVVVQAARSVMVVDDSLTMRKVLGRLLTREGYRVVTAKDGMEALQMLQEDVPDAIVLDIEMPRMDGFELARNIRNDARTAHLPLVVVSSRTAEKHRNLAVEIGINVYLGKPVQDEALLESLAALFASAGA